MNNRYLLSYVFFALVIHCIVYPVFAQGLPSELLHLTTDDILSEPSSDILPLYYDADLAKKTPTPTLTNTPLPSDTPTNTPSFTVSPSPTNTPTPRNTPTPTPTNTPRITPTPTPTVSVRIPAAKGFTQIIVIILLTVLFLPLVHKIRP